jgi:hypothetical protein
VASAGPEVLDGRALDVGLLNQLGAAVDRADEGVVRDTERGAKVSSGAPAVELRQLVNGDLAECVGAAGVGREPGASVEDPVELAADDFGDGEEPFEGAVVTSCGCERVHLEVLVVNGDDASGVQLGQ